jgi:serine/threonine protein phosphatase 1
MKTFVIGDIHASHKALTQCLERSHFDYENDILICLGDVADGWTEAYECFEELFKIKNLIYVRGNHDQWLKDWLKYGKKPDVWTLQGGQNTINSYLKEDPQNWKRHLEFLKNTPFYYIDNKNRCFVHGGISQQGIPIEQTDKMFLMWDRDLWNNRHNEIKLPYTEVFVGHTPIWNLSHFPIQYNNVWFMDTGGGWEGKLSIMNVNTKKIWQSDIVSQLYPEESGRLSHQKMSKSELRRILEQFKDKKYD